MYQALYRKYRPMNFSDVVGEEHITEILKNGGSKEEAMSYFIETFYGYRKNDMPPIDALNLNTGIMVDLIEREFVNL